MIGRANQSLFLKIAQNFKQIVDLKPENRGMRNSIQFHQSQEGTSNYENIPKKFQTFLHLREYLELLFGNRSTLRLNYSTVFSVQGQILGNDGQVLVPRLL